MNREQYNAQWQQLRTYILDRWNKLTDEDLRQISGRYDLLISKIQDKYGISREEIEEQFRSWKPNLKFENERREILTSRKEKEEEGSSLGKWLIAAGIPFLFLLGYLGTHYNTPEIKDNAYAPSSTTQTLFTKAPTSADLDTTISQNVRKVLFANTQLLNDLKDIRIDTANGVVTIYGSVKTEEEKSLVSSIIEKIAGVVKVNNKIEVRL